jgi:hypothetical protein
VLLLALTQCVSGPDGGDLPELYVSVESYDFSQNPELLERVLASPFGYFRFINQTFAKSICARFGEDLAGMPTVNLHGDPHIEQYSVSESGRGITDFDDASTGPAAVDLIRFGVSIHLAADAKGWSDKKTELVEEFFRAYREALEDPETTAPQPQIVDRTRGEFGSDRRSLLAWADSLMGPEPLRILFGQVAVRMFADVIHEENPDLPRSYFDVKKAGRLRLGVGSALDEKYLVRVEGPSDATDDDVLLEIKEVRDLSGIECIHRREKDPFPILAAQARIAYQPYRFTGFIYLDPRRVGESGLGPEFWDGSSFWVHTWVDHYQEITVDSLQSPEDLAEIAYDVGVQLGQGHPKGVSSPHDLQLRRAQLTVLDAYRPDIRNAIEDLAGEVERAWEEFRSEAARGRR